MRLSFVTYSYNDHAFASDLLCHVQRFGIPFHELILVDDASTPPFPEQNGIRILRHAENKGPAQAKRFGINATTGDVILSADADIRFSVTWLHNALRYITNQGIGIVGGTMLPSLGGDLLSRALHKMTVRGTADTDSPFLPGGLWLFRKHVWTQVGGLEEYTQNSHEDYCFCRKVIAAGYSLIAADSQPVYETRRLNRIQYCRRQARYFASALGSVILSKGIATALAGLEQNCDRCFAYAQKNDELFIVYVELLRIVAMLAEASKHGGMTAAGFTPAGMFAAATHTLQGYPQLRALLKQDIAVLTASDSSIGDDPASPCTELLAFLEQWDSSGWLARLETEGWAAKTRAEDSRNDFDGHYL